MLRLYGYLGLLLIAFAEINFIFAVQPFAAWYIPIVWYGFILFVDSLVYRIKKKSLLSTYPKELLLMMIVSIPFWLIFELYNIYTVSWIYTNYVWYVHIADFTTIVPALLETFTLLNVLNLGKSIDILRKTRAQQPSPAPWILVLIGVAASLLPIWIPSIGYPFMWIGLAILFEPLNFLTKRTSLLKKASAGERSPILRLCISGLIMGFFWEFWNYQAYPKWTYNLPYLFPNLHLFAMPLFGYLGYLPFAIEVFTFYVFFRKFIFKGKNELLGIEQS